MLLVEITIGGEVHRISNARYALEHYWDAKISSLGQISYSSAQLWGGYVAPTYGSIEILPDTFEGNWPPPIACPLKISLASVDEATAELVFEGTAHINSIGREVIVYDLYGPEYDNLVTDASYSGTVISIFTAAATTLGLSIDTSAARITSPSVDYSTSGSIQLLDNLSAIAAFYTHFFYIQEGVLYLVDALVDNGTLSLTEFDIFPSKYTYAQPYSRITAGDVGISGAYAYSDQELSVSPSCYYYEVEHADPPEGETEAEEAIRLDQEAAAETAATADIKANVVAALVNIRTVIREPRIQLAKPLEDIPTIGQKVIITDESLHSPITAWARVSSIVWDFDNVQCVVIGAGGIA